MLKIEKQAKSIKITENKESNYKGNFVVEPLYRGYGNTLGNALRRVLLSSIPGAAIKAIRIDGVLSEFTVMDGIKEAVTEIILNVKEIVVKAETTGERKMTLSVKGPRVVKASDIIPDAGIEIVNPDQVICNVTTDRTLDMEFIVDTGEGFVVSEEIDRKDWAVDFIAVDAIYTPIKRVSYEVQDTMFGGMTDFDKLTLSIETDGSIEIKDAISYAVEILKLHLDNLLEIGKNKCKITNVEEREFNYNFSSFNITIASNRLDTLVSEITKLSRTKSVEYIESGLVQIDYDVCKNKDEKIENGMIIIIRKYGKFILNSQLGESKKGKKKWEIKKYI